MDKNAWLIQLSQNPRTRFWKIDFSELSLPEQVFVTIWELEAEVNNGGFPQYYSNSAGDNALLAPSMLRTIAADKMARIVEEANAVFGSAGPPKNEEERQRTIESFTPATAEKFDELDTQFMTYPDNLTDSLYDYIQAEKDQIKGL
jgi:hypothetical protein